MSDPDNLIRHLHKSLDDPDLLKEISIVGINKSVYLRSTQKSDTLEGLSKLGIRTLKAIKKLEKE